MVPMRWDEREKEVVDDSPGPQACREGRMSGRASWRHLIDVRMGKEIANALQRLTEVKSGMFEVFLEKMKHVNL